MTGVFEYQPNMNSKNHDSLKAVLALAVAALDFQDIILILKFQLPQSILKSFVPAVEQQRP